jgi:hypothetical protein
MKSMSDEEDLALATLLSIRAEIAPDLDEDLLRKAYAIQRRHQFSDDHAQSSAAMERLIDEVISAQQPGSDQA